FASADVFSSFTIQLLVKTVPPVRNCSSKLSASATIYTDLARVFVSAPGNMTHIKNQRIRIYWG
ncbi:MAG: hypothetical protein JXR25_17075, partial [Pontiellaceae bacterium]|nr:hypothetical protein [Pontiellaceae bacterium]